MYQQMWGLYWDVICQTVHAVSKAKMKNVLNPRRSLSDHSHIVSFNMLGPMRHKSHQGNSYRLIVSFLWFTEIILYLDIPYKNQIKLKKLYEWNSLHLL